MDPQLMPWKLTLSYDGSAFHGWQVQPGLPTVQGVLAEAIRSVTGVTVLPQGSGRTDAGVHALAQVASFSLSAPIPAPNLQRALNRLLPRSIRILAAEQARPGFHARHSALRKTYQYRIFASASSIGERRLPVHRDDAAARICSPFLAPYVWACGWPLALRPLQAAAAQVCGTHDFTSFAASDPDHSAGAPNPTKTIFSSQWTREGDLLVYRIIGSGFLHHMVRTLVGTMVEVGRGHFDPGAMSRILLARSRAAAGPTAPAEGLFLESVEYADPPVYADLVKSAGATPPPAVPATAPDAAAAAAPECGAR